MRMNQRLKYIAIVSAVIIILSGLLACTTTHSPMPNPSVEIVDPVNGTKVPEGEVSIHIDITNFDIVDKLGEDPVTGEGHIHYYMDVDVPTDQGEPAVTAEGTYAVSTEETHTWSNVTPGTHTFAVQLVANDHTPLEIPVVDQVSVTVERDMAPVPVVVELSSIEAQEQLTRRVDEMRARGFIGSVDSGLDVVDGSYLKQLAIDGFEIMCQVPWQEDDTYEQQLQRTFQIKQSLEAAIGQDVVGFSPDGSRFNRGNVHTYPVLQEIGAKYILQSARYEKLTCYALEPYKASDYDFFIVPMQSRCVYNVGENEFDQTTLAMSGSI